MTLEQCSVTVSYYILKYLGKLEGVTEAPQRNSIRQLVAQRLFMPVLVEK